MGWFSSLLKLLTFIGEGFSAYYRRSELGQARRDGQNQAKLDEIIRNQDQEKRHDHAQGAIEEASKSLDDLSVLKRLRGK